MAAEYGTIVDVSTTNVGENLTLDAAAAATTIFVNNADTFNELGGQLTLNGTVYTYTNVAPESGEITLASGLVADAVVDDRAEIHPLKPITTALVDFGIEESEPVFVTLPHDMAATVADGFYEEAQRPSVLVDERSSGDLYVVDIPATPPAPVDVEITLGDGVPPIASPTPVVEGWVGALNVKWAAISGADFPEYEVHISTVNDFTPDATTLVGTTSATSFTIHSLPNDLLLAYNTTYYVKVVAYDVDGPAPAGNQSSAQLMPVTSDDISANYVYGGRIAAPQIDGGEVTADLLLSGRISTRPGGTGAGVDQDATGIAIYDSSGIPQTTLAPDQSVFKGDAEIAGLTVDGSMSIRGTNNEISTGGELDLAAGITAPSTSPSVVQDWETLTFTKAGDSGFNAANLTSVCKVGTLWVCGYRDGSVYRIYRFNADGTYNSDGAGAITSSTALQTTQITAGGTCYTVASNNTIYKHGNAPSYVLSDDFTSSINTTTWPSRSSVVWDSGSQSAKITGTGHLGTAFAYQHKDSFFSAKVTRTGASGGQDIYFGCFDQATDSEIGEIYLTGSTLKFRIYEPLTETIQFESSITYNATTHAYWKISETDSGAGGDLHFWTSPDGTNWTERYSNDHDFSTGELTNVQLWVDLDDDGATGTVDLFIDEVRHGLNSGGTSHSYSTLNTQGDVMTIGNDGTNLLLAEHDNSSSNDRLHVRVINPATMAVTSTFFGDQQPVGVEYNGPLAGILKGSFDLGADRYIWKRIGSTDGGENWLSTNTSNGDDMPAERFPADSGGSKAIVWDGSNFWALGTSGQLYKHTGVKHTSGTATVGWVYAFTWFDSNATGGTHETTVSPIASITLKKRARITVTAPNIPGAGGTDDPNCIRVYAGLNSGAMTLQTTTGAGVHSVVYNALVTGGAAPPGSNNFTAAAPAKIVNPSGTLQISGDGSILATTIAASPVATELGNAVNLDSITTPGIYSQASSAEAAAGSNYPALAPYAGILEVFGNPGTQTIRMQRYSAFRNSNVSPSPNIWERTWETASGWGAWRPLHYDSGWVTTIASVAVAATNFTITAAAVRRVDNAISFSLDYEWDAGTAISDGTGNIVGDPTIATMAAAWRPTGAPDQGGFTNNNGTRTIVHQIKATGAVVAVTSAGPDDFAANLAVSVGGVYFV